VQDPWEKYVPGLGLGRDPERTPMQWSPAPRAGFTDPDAEPWLPLADNYQAVNVAVQQADPHSMLTLTRRLVDLRRRSPALSVGSYAEVEAPGDLLTYVREAEGEKMLVVLNFGDAEVAWTPPEEVGTGLVVLSTRLDGPRRLDGALTVRSNEGMVIRVGVD
jgi:alpha-glucosidase